MSDTVKAIWQGNMHFISKTNEGEVNLDAAEEFGGENKGLRPKSLMLTSLAGCTGMDLGSLFKKMRVDVEGISIEVSGELSNEHPRIYKSTHITYTFTGKNLDKDKIIKAVDLSFNRYCGVVAMFQAFSEVTFNIVFETEAVG